MNKLCLFPGYIARPFAFILLCFTLVFNTPSSAQKKAAPKTKSSRFTSKRVIYGLASFYADRFNGRRTANGEIFSQRKLTCACNMLPFGTWVKVTNVRNGKWVVIKVNDRLHTRLRRLVDLSKAAARKLGSMTSGLVRVKLEVIGKENRAL